MKRILYTALAALSLVSPKLRAASDYLLEIEGIKGETSDTSAAIEISSFSWGVSNPPTTAAGGGGGAGKASFQDLHFTSSNAGKASPQLFLACAQGKHIPKAVLHIRKAGTTEVILKVTLEDILISGYQHKGSSTAPAQVESFSFNFAKIEYAHKDASGAVTKANWDLKTSTGG